MSFVYKGWLDTSRLRLSHDFAEKIAGEMQDTLNLVRKEGEDYLKSIVPVDESDLQASAHGGANQRVVYFRVAQEPKGDGRKYGIYQNYGYHDRGGRWHGGHFYMERTELFAAALLLQETGDVMARNGFIGALRQLPRDLSDQILGTYGPNLAPAQGGGAAVFPRGVEGKEPRTSNTARRITRARIGRNR